MAKAKKKGGEIIAESFFINKDKAEQWLENKKSKLGKIKNLNIDSKTTKGIIHCFVEKV